jgi:hypothetical protein
MDGYAAIMDIRGLHDTRGINNMQDKNRYQYTRFYIECINAMPLGIPSTLCSIKMEDVEDGLCTCTMPIGQKPKTKEHKLVTALIENCRKKIITQEKNHIELDIKDAISSATNERQYS